MTKGYILKYVDGKEMTPVVLDGSIVEGYYVDEDGNVWSNKQTRARKLKSCISGKSPYPAIGMRVNNVTKTVYLHRVVCETFHKFPHPEGITKKDWKATPHSIKSLLKSLYQVNHIDHNHENFHPSNLEWVTVKQNSNRYQVHVRG